MATIAVTDIINRAATLLQDPTNIRWPQAELLDWVNDGQREIALFKPNAFVKNTGVQLAAGTRQTIPTDGVSLVDIVRNLGADGMTSGRAVRVVSREILDSQIPNWHSDTPSNAVKHFTYTPLDPKHFYVYPPQPDISRGYVEMVYVAYPTNCTLSSTISLDDIYMSALLNYVLYRAYSKDAEFAANAAAASSYYQTFQGILTGKITAEGASNPNVALGPFNPNVPGSGA